MPNFEQTKKDKNYTKLLNNLLDIRRADSSILTKTSTNKNFDLFTMFQNDVKCLDLIFDEKEFTLQLTTKWMEEFIDELKEVYQNFENHSEYSFLVKQRIDRLCQKYDWKLSKKQQNGLELSDKSEIVRETLLEIVDSLEIERQKFIKTWTKYAKEVNDEIDQKGTSPLYVATCFLKGTNQNQSMGFNAPLLLRELNINVLKDSVKITSSSDWIINEKLVFHFERIGYTLPKKLDFEDEKSFSEILNDVLSRIQLDAPAKNGYFISKFKNFKKEEISNKKIEIMPGIVMGWFNPVGGYLRELMQKIIDDNEIDQIIDTNPIKSIYQNKIMTEIENNYEKLVKIQELNYAQDKALVSALNQDTIIWGPPGTGKSQVIANIIANILYTNKRAIVMSQKMAALSVIKKRLGKLAKFILFSFDSKQMKKEDFYEQLNDFLKTVEKFDDSDINYRKAKPLISKEKINILNFVERLKAKGEYDSIVKIYKLNGNKYDQMKQISFLNKNYYYPENATNDQNYFLESLANLNNIKKNGYIFWWKYKDSFIEEVNKAFQTMNDHEIHDLEKYIAPFRKTSFDNVRLVGEIPKVLGNDETDLDFQSDEDYLENYLATKIAKKIENWSFFDRDNLVKYNKFASAIRAKRRLPNKFINDHLEILNELFPIIVTTPEQIFVGYEKNYFDYAVVDEASQIFLEVGLPILYLAKTKILAGDPEQMRPTSWFSTRDVADEYDEEDVEENALSLLDYAIDKGVNQVLLNQNYRSSSAALMSFSSKEYYNSELEVIDKQTLLDEFSFTNKPIKIVQVNGEWNKGTNEQEAREVVKILKQTHENYENIIVLAFNIKQKQLIEEMISFSESKIWNKVLERKISIRNIENIQGDEADLVIMSVVYAPETRVMGTYVVRNGGRNALNVAVSRAKEQMIIVKSVNANNLANGSGENYETFRRWLYFLDLDNPKQKTYSITEVKRIESYSESDFEETVYQRLLTDLKLIQEELKLFQQYPIGSKRIDIAVLDENDNYILGIEVDGYKYHSTIDKYLKDLSRENFIKSKGYDITRIKDINWYLDSDAEVRRIEFLINDKLKQSNLNRNDEKQLIENNDSNKYWWDQ
ncbi:hypothetical protein LD125_00472 [Mesoplasma sp. JKS002658]|uniref:AAA domain-containing protein n=2 Tax=Mesoplasma whartonense TaxID=2878854 RepID=UPI002022A4E1|nr:MULTISPECIES: AAA domain-containing protein [unclassified Mesoplasma]MCL8214747.1 hypothetical protein [Mesoplasma sp. JKS002663]MCL8211410.1 hypothetical protein [Mesoplasma sp. JKS002664]MCL8212262.1 hypothetical protein [Mesoplasma sp. JKS002662]MCL8214209.1 hypothetical protein [Mesoplasma sp. JKS002658]MCL8215528.1 hypothetical protein [Mesoplasma sp. JKS002659]